MGAAPPPEKSLADLPLVQASWGISLHGRRHRADLPRSWVAVKAGMFGCIACAANPKSYAFPGSTKAFGNFQVPTFHKGNFQRHHNTMAHKTACLAMLGMDPNSETYVGPSEAGCHACNSPKTA